MNSFIKKEGIDYISNFYRYDYYKNDKNNILLTTDDGNFLFLNQSSFKQLKRGKIEDKDIYKKLIDKGFIINQDNFQNVVDKTRKRYTFLMNGTSLHIVVPTSRCNQACPYCFAAPDHIGADKEKTDMSEETAKKTIDFILQSPSYAITIEFTGGEALARFDIIKDMIEYAKKKNESLKKDLRFTIVTNLTMASERMLEWLIDNDITICTSLDGPKQVHDKNRIILGAKGKVIGTYDKVIYWINWVNEKYKEKNKPQKLSALMTITKYSLPYHKEIIDLYVSLGMNLVDVRALTMVGNIMDIGARDMWYSKEDFIDFYLKSIAYIDELRSKGVDLDDRMRDLYNKKILENEPTYHTDYESPWGAAIGGLTYNADGSIYACHEAMGQKEFNLGNVHKDTWKTLFKKDETSFVIMSSMLEANPMCDRCALKPYCGTIPIENYSMFGKFNFYPSKTSRHHETTFHAHRVFDKILNKLELSKN